MSDAQTLVEARSKVPEVVLTFWVIKIAATTLGETGGDTVTMTMNLGYLTGTAIFLTVLAGLVWWQIAAKRFHPFLYWATIVASTTAGTTMADFADRSLGIGYTGGSTLLLVCLLATLGLWYRVRLLARASAAAMQKVSDSQPCTRASLLAIIWASVARSETGAPTTTCGDPAAAAASAARLRPSPTSTKPSGDTVLAEIAASITIPQRFSGE